MQSVRSILVLFLATATAGFLAPDPTGKYNVTLTTGTLVDYSRNDAYAALPTPRALMLSVFQPATCASIVSVPYMPDKTAEYQGPFIQQSFNISADLTPLFLEARLPVCSDHPGSCSPLENRPILLFSPGYSTPRLYYSVIASAIASEGFVVITIDHPEDANIIVYPDGHVVYNNASILDSPTWNDWDRAADASFIVDQLSNATAMAALLPGRGRRAFATDRVAMLGHSAGGVAAILAASQDRRIRAAANWDGTIIGSPALPQISQPVLFFTHDPTTDASWLAAWPQLTGPKIVLRVANTTHQSFSDVPSLIVAAGLSTAPFADVVGAIVPARMVRLLTAYTTAWMDGAFKGREAGPLLQGKEPGRFPEVSVLTKENF
ncbi:PAF acetylhydrolase [Lasiosphaeria miniovina]|uniref:1-alkyl-2-acetylglycerophosphocholine esterase n=1 Tax=Lasiosphaeria miniovina TaxID=1954250 RepID=A0AA40A511_9PEZI|nr:PAF acetylhydrolase [Lasiosphaeria miniovina]KAK0709382.1 PAF acetylhydrolase [Lasiosphaeria miniovina]